MSEQSLTKQLTQQAGRLHEDLGEANDRITYLEAVVEAWRERFAKDHVTRLASTDPKTVARLVELDQIEPVREGEYLRLKEPTP